VPADKRYFVSILPESGYSNSGASVAVGQGEATIIASSLPLPTAQISIFVFEDNMSINNAPDLPGERGLEGFKVVLYEAGGTFGMSGGQAMMDIFGNMVGSAYDADGNLLMMGDGYVITDEIGEALIQNLSEGKFTLQVVPPAGKGWVQTATIEGTKGIDAWVKPNEPRFFAEFGPPGCHTFYGFTKAMDDASALTGDRNITGNVVNLHNSRPPEYTFHAGEPVPGAWVGLNTMSVGRGRGIFAAPCDDSGSFIIPNVPPGNYQLVVWEDALDVIFAFHTVAVTADADVDLGPVPVFNWFARLDNYVFNDANENGFWDPASNPFRNNFAISDSETVRFISLLQQI